MTQQNYDYSNTIYGTVVCVVKNNQLYLSRRTEKTIISPKKWQTVNGLLASQSEMSVQAAIRLVKEQMDIDVHDKSRYTFADTLNTEDKKFFYFVYLLNLYLSISNN